MQLLLAISVFSPEDSSNAGTQFSHVAISKMHYFSIDPDDCKQ